MSKSLQFGILTLQDEPWMKLVTQWQHIEVLDFDSVWIADHLVDPYSPHVNWLDGWSLLAALATQTHKIHIGTLVTNFIYRNPTVIAKQALTVDHISRGRLSLGLGATTEIDPSHAMVGLPVWKTAERVERFREVVEIVDGLLRSEITAYQGRYYQVSGAVMNPAPVQKPRPPFTIAAHREKTCKIAARYADTWNTYGEFDLSAQQAKEALRQQCELLDEYCIEINRDPGEITRSFLVGFTGDKPFASIDAFHDFVNSYNEIGITEFIFYYDRPGMSPERHLTFDMAERIALEETPKLKSKDTE